MVENSATRASPRGAVEATDPAASWDERTATRCVGSDARHPGVAMRVQVDEPSLLRRIASRSGVMVMPIEPPSSYWASSAWARSRPLAR